MENVLFLTTIISATIVFKIVINIHTGNNKSNKDSTNQATIILVQAAQTAAPIPPTPPAQQDDSGWILLVVIGLVGFLAYLYALSPEIFTDLFFLGN